MLKEKKLLGKKVYSTGDLNMTICEIQNNTGVEMELISTLEIQTALNERPGERCHKVPPGGRVSLFHRYYRMYADIPTTPNAITVFEPASMSELGRERLKQVEQFDSFLLNVEKQQRALR